MKTKNKIISWALLWAIVTPSFAALKLEANASGGLGLSDEEQVVIGISKTQAEIDNPELERENYTLIRVIKSEETSFACYEHEETKAQVVVDLDETKKDKFEIMYRLPVLDNTGTNHILEHCIAHDMPFPNVDAHTVCNVVGFVVKSVNDLGNSNFFDNLQNPEFMKNRKIFEVARNSVYWEQLRGRCDTNFFNMYKFECKGSKHELFYGGIVEEIKKCEYESVCEAFDKYIHPSNSLTFIEGRNSVPMMEILHERYLKEKVERTTNFPDVECLDQEKDYYEFKSGKAKAFEFGEEAYKYKATIIYDFGKLDVKAKDISKIEDLFKNLVDESLGNVLGSKGMQRYSTRIEYQHNVNKALSVDLYTDKEWAVKEANLREVSKMIFDFMNNKIQNLCSCPRCFDKANADITSGLFLHCFGKYASPFPREVFDIRDSRINWESDLEEIQVIMGSEKISTRIMSLTKIGGKGFYDKYWFSLPLPGKYNRETWLLSRIVGYYLICSELTRTGIGYGCDPCEGEKEAWFGIAGDVKELRSFSRGRFLERLKNFEITQDMFDTVVRNFEDEGEDFSDITLQDINRYFEKTKWKKLTDILFAHTRKHFDNGEQGDFMVCDNRGKNIIEDNISILLTKPLCDQNEDLDLVCAQVLLNHVLRLDLERIVRDKVKIERYCEDGKVGFKILCPRCKLDEVRKYFDNNQYSLRVKDFKPNQKIINKASEGFELKKKIIVKDLQQHKASWQKLALEIEE